jgi:LuxR family quorum sensing-dependent transcriptional regulator
MLLTDTGFHLVEHLERQRGVPALMASFQRMVLAFGMDCFWMGDTSQPAAQKENRRWGATFPVSLYWHYECQDHMPHDPVAERMNRSRARFRWSDTYATANARGQRVLDEIAEFGFREGLAIPIHQADGSVTGVSISGRNYALTQRDEVALHMAALYLHAKVAGLRASAAAPAAPRMTPRERECLKWVSAGKTDWEISQILNISEQTAHGYVQNALRKLGARTRAQAVALAIVSAQIAP